MIKRYLSRDVIFDQLIINIKIKDVSCICTKIMVTTVGVLLWYLKLKHMKQDTYHAIYHSNCGFTVIFEFKT